MPPDDKILNHPLHEFYERNRTDVEARAEFLQRQAFAILAFTYPQPALNVVKAAIEIERGQGFTEDRDAEMVRQAILAANEAFVKACEEIFLPLIEAWPKVFKDESILQPRAPSA